METKNLTDVTDLTDAALDVVIAVKAGQDFVDADKLTVAERFSVAAALGWEMNARVRHWCQDPPSPDYRPADGRVVFGGGRDAEHLILEDQESDESWWG